MKKIMLGFVLFSSFTIAKCAEENIVQAAKESRSLQKIEVTLSICKAGAEQQKAANTEMQKLHQDLITKTTDAKNAIVELSNSSGRQLPLNVSHINNSMGFTPVASAIEPQKPAALIDRSEEGAAYWKAMNDAHAEEFWTLKGNMNSLAGDVDFLHTHATPFIAAENEHTQLKEDASSKLALAAQAAQKSRKYLTTLKEQEDAALKQERFSRDEEWKKLAGTHVGSELEHKSSEE